MDMDMESEPLPPDVVEAVSRIERAGAILPLWVVMAIFGHIFSFLFLVHGLFLYKPRLKRELYPRALLRRLQGCFRPVSRATSEDLSQQPQGVAASAAMQSRTPLDGGDNVSAAGPVIGWIREGASVGDLEAGGFLGSQGGSSGGGATEGGDLQAMSTTALDAALGYGQDESYDKGAIQQVCLEWRSITLAVAGPRGLTTLLHGVGGRAPPSAVTVLLGPSGAGKSTLLDLLALRGAAAVPERGGGDEGSAAASPGPGPGPGPGHGPLKAAGRAGETLRQPGCSGQVLVNGASRNRTAFLQMSSYVPQVDAFLPQLTVREALTFTGRLVLAPPECEPTAVAARATAVATALGLCASMDTMIGGVLPGGLLLRGLSGGERKRLSIGQGLMSRPRVLLLDEPTSGLDSFAAAVVMGHVAALAARPGRRLGHRLWHASGCGGNGGGKGRGVTVVAALHQPRAAIWEVVDQVVVLGRGRLLYCGPPSELLPWFRDRLGYCYNPEHHGMVSDWVMDLLALPEGGEMAVATAAAVMAGRGDGAVAAAKAVAGAGGGGNLSGLDMMSAKASGGKEGLAIDEGHGSGSGDGSGEGSSPSSSGGGAAAIRAKSKL